MVEDRGKQHSASADGFVGSAYDNDILLNDLEQPKHLLVYNLGLGDSDQAFHSSLPCDQLSTSAFVPKQPKIGEGTHGRRKAKIVCKHTKSVRRCAKSAGTQFHCCKGTTSKKWREPTEKDLRADSTAVIVHEKDQLAADQLRLGEKNAVDANVLQLFNSEEHAAELMTILSRTDLTVKEKGHTGWTVATNSANNKKEKALPGWTVVTSSSNNTINRIISRIIHRDKTRTDNTVRVIYHQQHIISTTSAMPLSSTWLVIKCFMTAGTEMLTARGPTRSRNFLLTLSITINRPGREEITNFISTDTPSVWDSENQGR